MVIHLREKLVDERFRLVQLRGVGDIVTANAKICGIMNSEFENRTLSVLLAKLRSIGGVFEERGFTLGRRDLHPTHPIRRHRK